MRVPGRASTPAILPWEPGPGHVGSLLLAGLAAARLQKAPKVVEDHLVITLPSFQPVV